jgi:hypothetical protein
MRYVSDYEPMAERAPTFGVGRMASDYDVMRD